MRAFLAIPLPVCCARVSDPARGTTEGLQEARGQSPSRSRLGTRIGTLRDSMRNWGLHAAWVKTDNFHLTLRFLGECNQATLDYVAAQLRESLHGIKQFRLHLAGVGAFPNARRPAILWVGLTALGREELVAIQRHTESAARRAGLPPEGKSFHGHITLARIKTRPKDDRLIRWINEHAGFDAGEFGVEALVLYRSELKAGGSVYVALDSFPLGRIDQL